MKLKLKNIIYLLFLIVLSITMNNLLTLEVDSNNSLNIKEYQNCSPIIENAKNLVYNINGVNYPQYLPIAVNNSYNFTCMNQNNNSKLILFWNKLHGDSGFRFGIGKEMLFKKNQCPLSNCETTNDRKRLNESDLVVFSMYDDIDKLPEIRFKHQRWVFVMSEAPNRNKYLNYNALFNLSATYRHDSNFSHPYLGSFPYKWKLNKTFDTEKDYTQGKKKFAYQLASHCLTSSNRANFIKDIQNYIQVDIYGKCGQKCPIDNWLGCRDLLNKEYKFYLAFENTLCDDYMTEKFFLTLHFDIIPVVYGLGDYEKYIPKSAFINIFDFNSTKELTDYLHYVSNNKTLYNSYFQWKRFINFDRTPTLYGGHICEMCILLNLEYYFGIKESRLNGLDEFWNSTIDCKRFNINSYQLEKW